MARGDGIEAQISVIFEEFQRKTIEELSKAVHKASMQCKRDIVAASPENTGDYKKGWTVRTRKSKHGIEAIVYNKTKPQLTHVLEKSHVIRNANGTYGRTGPGHGQVVHIAPAREAAEAYLLDQLKSKL